MSEHALQVAVNHMLQVVLDPERTWYSALDHGAGKLSKRAAGMMKARGVKPGMPDFILMWMDDNLIGIELKSAKGTVSPAQSDVATYWTLMGFGVFVARSLEEVQDILENCRVPLRRRLVFFPKQGSPFDGGDDEPARRPAPARHRRARRPRQSKNDLPMVQPRAKEA